MIYDIPSEEKPIQQGDIFYPLPLPIIPLKNMMSVQKDGKTISKNWDNLREEKNITIHTPIVPTYGIVATQDCDAMRAPIISLFRINLFEKVTGLDLPTKTKKWTSLITKISRLNARWFYLPEYKGIGFKKRMAIDFHTVFQIPRTDLEENISLRIGRLCKVAYEHYKERIAFYFRRFPYDEWYPLNKSEFEVYKKDSDKSVKPYPWQE